MAFEIDPRTFLLACGLFMFILLGAWLWAIHHGPLKP